jgi:DNA-binding response OmpR family regulator
VLRRSPERPTDVTDVPFPGGVADLRRAEIRFDDGSRADLSEREGELLAYLARNPGRAVSRDEILSRVWRIDPRGGETRTIDMHVARLREKLKDDPASPRVILTVRGKGYSLGEQCAVRSA